jgi:hypothetical protein
LIGSADPNPSDFRRKNRWQLERLGHTRSHPEHGR